MTQTPQPLSIVLVLAPARFGGLETAVLELASGLVLAGDSVCVAPVLSGEDDAAHPLVQALEERGVAVAPALVGARHYRSERQFVKALLQSRKAQVLHTHGGRSDVVDGPVARKMGIPTITTVHGFTGAGGWKGRVQRWLQRRSFRRFDRVIAVSERLRGELVASGAPQDRVITVRNALGTGGPTLDRTAARARLGLPSEGRFVAWVGRMTKEKGPDVMVTAAALVSDRQVRFSMIGTGPMEGACRALADSLGVGKRIEWHGVVGDIGQSLGAFDVLALTSWTEGTPMVLLEAMAAGVPIVATSVGGIPEVASSNEALLCPAGAVQDIAGAIDEVLAAPADATGRARAARHRLEGEFEVGAWVQRHREIYHSVLQDGVGPWPS